MLVELEGLSGTAVYHLMTQVVVPRPIAWVVSDNGTDDASRWNLAPFSYFNAVASDPPMVMFSVGRSRREGSGVKDTLANVMARPEHTIALPNRAQLEAVEATAVEAPPGTSEFTLAGMEPVPWGWSVPMPDGVRVALGCSVERIIPISDGPQRLVLSRVHRVWVAEDAVEVDAKGRPSIDATRLDPLLRLGSGAYAEMGPTARPSSAGRSSV
jgi:flavin reductase (DIM6/NTAB) family NADH-FMN oxidoreductase RutF